MSSPAEMEQAFLADIVAHPEDPALWLILADWLEERDDPRAELVRLTWSLRHEPAAVDFSAREARVQSLLAGGVQPVVPVCTLDGIRFAWIPPGIFTMGSPVSEYGRDDDEGVREVTLTRGFWMGVHPVTRHQWRVVMGNDPSYFGAPLAECTRLPVERVSWPETQEFCARMTARLGEPFRLPTEAEWEYACRAGTRTPFHFGRVLNGTQANCNGAEPYGTVDEGPSPARPIAVGSFPPNAFGLYDMHGNVWEWVHDLKAYYSIGPLVDPVQIQGGSSHVFRGGSWDRTGRQCRSAYRDSASTEYRSSTTGLRICFHPTSTSSSVRP